MTLPYNFIQLYLRRTLVLQNIRSTVDRRLPTVFPNVQVSDTRADNMEYKRLLIKIYFTNFYSNTTTRKVTNSFFKNIVCHLFILTITKIFIIHLL